MEYASSSVAALAVATYAKPCEVRLRATAKAAAAEEALAMLAPVERMVKDTLGEIVYGVDISGLAEACLMLLKEKEIGRAHV